MIWDRRRRVTSNPPLNGSNANSNAVTAAQQVFNKASNASLAAAAAGAALRSRPTTPISMADVQTKRTIRRANSVSSQGSSGAQPTRGPPGSQLERRGSFGSMSERSFRDPSPARSYRVPMVDDAPPVPAIPQSHRRAASLEAPAMRVTSPPPNRGNGRGSSLGPMTTASPARRAGQRYSSISSIQELKGPDLPASRGSVNFSLPTSLRPASPVEQRRLTFTPLQRANPARITTSDNQNLVYDPNTRRFLPEIEILAIEQRIQDVVNKPVHKKKRIAPKQATGTHLAQGTVGGRPRGTAIDAMESTTNQQPGPVELPSLVPTSVTSPAPEIPSMSPARNKKMKTLVMSDLEGDPASHMSNFSENTGNDSTTRPQTFNSRSGGQLMKKPSVVREDKEREEQEDDTPTRPKVQEELTTLDTSPAARTVSPTQLPRSKAGRSHGRGYSLSLGSYAQDKPYTVSAIEPTLSPTDSSPTAVNGVGFAAQDSIRGSRVQSVSPVRTTHFSTLTPDNLVIKHEPPGRSVSPRKSALKHSNSPRGQSPVTMTGPIGQGQEFSEASNLSSVSTIDSDDFVVPKKKANHVSFDETNVMVGEAATPMSSESPVVSSPQTKKWLGFSIGRGKKKEPAAIEDDEVMKPRPALPSFGSIREKKNTREVEERPLVKPMEPVQQKQTHFIPLYTSPTGEIIEDPLGQSNDHIVGAILSQDAAIKNAANISKSREPLPPQVTSVEGSGYHSDSDSSEYASDTKVLNGLVGVETVQYQSNGANTEAIDPLSTPELSEDDDGIPTPTVPTEALEEIDRNIPQIAVVQATPTLEETDAAREWPAMPGAWGGSDTSSNSDAGDSPLLDENWRNIVEHQATDPTPADVGISEPDPIPHLPGAPVVGVIAAQNSSHTTNGIAEETESETESIYSDAAEDLSDFEGDGFMSLDAVVESPITKSTIAGLGLSTPPESPSTKTMGERQLFGRENEPKVNDGWDKVQAYWSTLSSEKKKKLEMEAREDAQDGSDTKQEAKATPEPSMKNKAALKPALKSSSPPVKTYEQHQHSMSYDRNYMIQPGAKAGINGHVSMRTSMRADPLNTAEETHLRKSMRGSTTMRGSVKGPWESGSKVALQKKHRPMSYPSNDFKADPAAVKNHILALSAASARAAQGAAEKEMTSPVPALRLKGSGDSESSFRRTRPASNDVPNFRRSMRGSGEQETTASQRSPAYSGRFSLRSLSPTGPASRRPLNGSANPASPLSIPQTHMRSSMRGSHDSAPTMRSNGMNRFGGFSKPSKKAAAKPQRSRFVDSSDEDEDQPTIFKSRFADSSDEEEPKPREKSMRSTFRSGGTSTRGISKRLGMEDGDSSDLPDSDDEVRSPASPGLKIGKNKYRKQNGVTANGISSHGIGLSSGSLRRSGSGRDLISTVTTISGPAKPDPKRRSSFMSILGRKKPDPSAKVRKSDAESPARRDTPLERSKSELSVLRGERPMSPKLQKRNTISNHTSTSWPLPASGPLPSLSGVQEDISGEDGRPSTADKLLNDTMTGLNGIGRPGVGNRRFTATGLEGLHFAHVEEESVTSGTGKKKKKFGKLRKIFKLDD